jgi:hypothetical protein
LSGAGADFAYDAVIADVARHTGGAVARSDARNFVYPVDPAIVGSTTWSLRLTLLPLSVVLIGLALVVFVAQRRAQRLAGSRNLAERLGSLSAVE